MHSMQAGRREVNIESVEPCGPKRWQETANCWTFVQRCFNHPLPSLNEKQLEHLVCLAKNTYNTYLTRFCHQGYRQEEIRLTGFVLQQLQFLLHSWRYTALVPLGNLPQQEMCVQNKNFGFVFGIFLAAVWPQHLNIARCKTSVDLLSYGVGIGLLKGDSQEKMCVQCLSKDGRTDGRTQPNTIVHKPFERLGTENNLFDRFITLHYIHDLCRA